MKKSELRKIIKEELDKVLNEVVKLNLGDSNSTLLMKPNSNDEEFKLVQGNNKIIIDPADVGLFIAAMKIIDKSRS